MRLGARIRERRWQPEPQQSKRQEWAFRRQGQTSVCDWLTPAPEKRQTGWACYSFDFPKFANKLRLEFDSHVAKWQSDTEDYSLLVLRFAHSSYLRIAGMGPTAIPWVLEELRSDPDWWFEALKAMSGTDPAKNSSTFDEAIEAWLAWGSEQGYA